MLGARLAEANLSRLIFPDLLADLGALRTAVRVGDAEEVYRKLSRLDRVLADMAERAARFYLMLADLARANDTRPEVFLTHKDALLAHLRDFELELARYAPRSRPSSRWRSTGRLTPAWIGWWSWPPKPTSGRC